MVAYAAYFDESDDNERAYAMGGFIGNQFDCIHLDWAWREQILDAYDLKYFKASELNSGTGEFAKFRDDPNCLRTPFSKRESDLFREIKVKTVDLFLNAEFLVGFGVVLLLPDYYRLRDELATNSLALPEPYFLCAGICMMEAGFAMNHFNAGEPKSQLDYLSPTFDSHKEYSRKANMMFEQFRARNPICAQLLLPPHYEDDQDYVVLQVADNLAWEMRRLVVGAEMEPPVKERGAMTKLKGRIEKIYKLNYECLKTIMKSPPNVIPIEPEIRNRSRDRFR
jgi:hypothetical protein